MKKKASHPITFLPCFSLLFNFKSTTSRPVYSNNTNTFISTNLWPKQALEQFYFIFLLPETATSTLLKHRIKNNHKREKNTMQFICISHPHDNVPPLSNRLPAKKKKVRRWDLKRGWSSVGQRRAESSPDSGNTSEILWNHRKGKRRELEVRSWCFCTSNSRQGWYFALPVSSCNPRTPESRLGFEQGMGQC